MARFRGTGGNNTIVGTPNYDVIEGLGGNDTLSGRGSKDDMYGGPGRDTMFGDSGDDYLRGGDGRDHLDGGPGADYLGGDGGDDTLWGFDGNDRLYGGSGADELEGFLGDDRLYGGLNDDRLYDTSGTNLLEGGDGNDELTASKDEAAIVMHNTMNGGNGNDRLFANFNPATDNQGVISSTSSHAVMIGGAGADVFEVYSHTPDTTPHGSNDRADITDFNAAEGDRLTFYYSNWTGEGQFWYGPQELFAALDTSANQLLDDDDANVSFNGQALEVAFGGDGATGGEDLIVIAGINHVSADWLV